MSKSPEVVVEIPDCTYRTWNTWTPSTPVSSVEGEIQEMLENQWRIVAMTAVQNTLHVYFERPSALRNFKKTKKSPEASGGG